MAIVLRASDDFFTLTTLVLTLFVLMTSILTTVRPMTFGLTTFAHTIFVLERTSDVASRPNQKLACSVTHNTLLVFTKTMQLTDESSAVD
jgi:hypothetical protein